MIKLLKYLPLTEYRFEFFLSYDLIFLHNFHSIEATCIFLAYENNSGETTSAYHFNLLKVLFTYFSLPICYQFYENRVKYINEKERDIGREFWGGFIYNSLLAK